MGVFQSINWLFDDQEPTLRQDASGVQPKELREALHGLRAVGAGCGHVR